MAGARLALPTSPVGFTTILTAVTVVPALSVPAPTVAGRFRQRLHFQESNGADEGRPPRPVGGAPARLPAELHRLAEESARLPGQRPLRLDQAGPYEDQYGGLDTITDGLGPQWKALSAATSMLISLTPSKARLVTGFLLGMPPSSAGSRRSMASGSHGDDQLRRSRVPARSGRRPRPAGRPCRRRAPLSCYPDAVLGGTGSWASYVAWSAGYAWEARGDLDRAKERYRAACADPHNLAASATSRRSSSSTSTRLPPTTCPPIRPSRSLPGLSLIIAPGSGVTSNNFQRYRARDLLARDLRHRIETGRPGRWHHPRVLRAKSRAAALLLVARQATPQATLSGR